MFKPSFLVFLLKLKSNLMSDDVREIIEEIVRDEVRKIWDKRGRTWRKSIENIMEETKGEGSTTAT